MTEPTTYAGWLEYWESCIYDMHTLQMLENLLPFAKSQNEIQANDCNRSRLEVLTRLIERKKAEL